MFLKFDPQIKKMAFVSWDAMTQLNDWFESELMQACRPEKADARTITQP